MAAARTVVLGLALLAPMGFAQAPPPASGLSETQADKLTINTLLLQRNQRDHDDLLRERQVLIQQIESTNPGKRWNEQSGTLQPVATSGTSNGLDAPASHSLNASPVTHGANPPTRK